MVGAEWWYSDCIAFYFHSFVGRPNLGSHFVLHSYFPQWTNSTWDRALFFIAIFLMDKLNLGACF